VGSNPRTHQEISKEDLDMKHREDSQRTVAVIPAAGVGRRMGGTQAKQFLEIDGHPLLALTLEKFQNCPAIESVVVVVSSESVEHCKREIVERYRLSKVERVVAGGRRRQDSVRLGIEATEGKYALVLIHDGVRPLVQVDLITRVVARAKETGAAIAALPAKETVKEVDGNNRVIKTYDRRQVWLVQTPQVFRYEDILSAHRHATEENWEEMTDDALLLERMGVPIAVVEGQEENIKITTPYDVELAKFILSRDKLHNGSTKK
jgi:2-C-methyl-D-erythritol 4-phosphate cytidylyltransferase